MFDIVVARPETEVNNDARFVLLSRNRSFDTPTNVVVAPQRRKCFWRHVAVVAALTPDADEGNREAAAAYNGSLKERSGAERLLSRFLHNDSNAVP